MNHDPKLLWPGNRAAGRRLLIIALVVLPLVLVVLTLSDESRRHLPSWAIFSVAIIVVIFFTSLLPTVQRLFHWLFSRRVIRRMLIVTAWLVTIVALFYAEEDWRGSHEWNRYCQQLEAKGAQLDYHAFIPKPVPADQNFAAIPVVESWFTQRTNSAKKWSDNYALASSMVGSKTNPPAPEGNSQQGGRRYFLDLVAWKETFDAIQAGQTNTSQHFTSGELDLASRAAAAPAVLADLVSSETELNQLRAASDRPDARYPIVYDLDNPWGILLPHLGNIKRTDQRLQLRTCAELAAGRSDDALADVKLMLYLADSVKDEPFMISYLVRIVCVQLAIQPVWEGLAEHAWSDAQLQELQARFQQYNFVADIKPRLDSERAAAILTADLLARGKYRLNDLTAMADNPNRPGSTFDSLLGWMAPRGWYHLEQLSYCQLFQLDLKGTFDGEKKRVYPGPIASNSQALYQALAGRTSITTVCTRHQFLAAIMLPALSRVLIRAAAVQTAVDEAAIACALERYRLANGHFPESLGLLVPKFISQLPNDVISGEPYKYRLTHSGRFVLYSVGWNDKDDGGVPGKTLFDDKEGDWVWQYPAK